MRQCAAVSIHLSFIMVAPHLKRGFFPEKKNTFISLHKTYIVPNFTTTPKGEVFQKLKLYETLNDLYVRKP